MNRDLALANAIAWGSLSGGTAIHIICPVCGEPFWEVLEKKITPLPAGFHNYQLRKCCGCNTIIETSSHIRKISRFELLSTHGVRI